MPSKIVSSAIRTTKEDFKIIDAIGASFGFKARSKFMLHAAKTYGRASDDPLVFELSQIAFALHQVANAGTGRLHLLKDGDVIDLKRRAQCALNAVIERNQQ